jgi:hypothetical protein
MECPVCNNPELPDYLSEPTYCPTCKSDLKGFLLVNRVEKESGLKLKRFKLLSSSLAISLLICILGSFFYFRDFAGDKTEKSIIKNDSTEYYKKLAGELSQKLNEKAESVDVIYVIKKDDNLSEVAKLFFNDGSRVKQIITDNNLQKGYNLLPGDTLIIKFKNQ